VLGDKTRTLVDCSPVVGDRHWSRVSWKGTDALGVKKGQPVTLRVEV